MTTIVINTLMKKTPPKAPFKDKLLRQKTILKLSEQRKEKQLRSQKKYIPLLPSKLPQSEALSDVYHFYRQSPGEDQPSLVFSYGAGLGAVIIRGLPSQYSWRVEDDKGKIVFSRKANT